jgi:hypothetical protein
MKIEVLDHFIMGRATTERPKDYSSLRQPGPITLVPSLA